MNIITIDNKHYIPARVVMLPTEVVSGIWKRKEQLFYSQYSSPIDGAIPQHLYLVCDFEIQEGDWHFFEEEIKQTTKDTVDYINNSGDNDFRKIVASTNNNLKQFYWNNSFDKIMQFILPQFPQSFIKEFVERQGKDVDVLVEVDVQNFLEKENNVFEEKELISSKLNPDNTVNLIFK